VRVVTEHSRNAIFPLSVLCPLLSAALATSMGAVFPSPKDEAWISQPIEEEHGTVLYSSSALLLVLLGSLSLIIIIFIR
jgi:hypothetical protein